MSSDRPTEAAPPPPPDQPDSRDPINEPIGEQAMQKWDEGMDKLNAENLIALRNQQDILRSQGNDEGAAELEKQVARIPLSDEIKADPQAYLDGTAAQRPQNEAATETSPTRESPSTARLGLDDAARVSYVARTPVNADFEPAADGKPADAWQQLTGEAAEHVPGVFDRRDIGQPVDSAGKATLNELPTNDELLDGVNRFYRGRPGEERGTDQYLWNCTACVKAVDSRLSGTEPDAHAGYIADPPGAKYESAVTDAVYRETLEREWGAPIEPASRADVETAMLDAGPGARGVLVGDRHVVNVVNRDGVVVVLDGQSGEACELADYDGMQVRGLLRTDANR